MDYIATTLNQTVEALINPTTPVYGADLYTGVDATTLNIFEQWWLKWYVYWGNPVIATGIMSFVLHEIVYFGRAIPFIIIDAMPSMRKYKLQDDKIPTAKQQWDCTKYVLLSHFTVELPQIWSFHPICEYLGMSTHSVPFPSILKIAWQISLFFIFEDTFHYWAHRALHWGPLYKYIHKKHHEFAAPFGLAAEYAHPLEVFILGTGTIGGPFLLCALNRDLHILTVYIWIVLRLFQAIDAHSGYDFPISMHNWIPFWSGADHHDYHHQAFVGCYSTSFRWWDHLMGTDLSYKRYRARQKEQKKLMANGMTDKEAKEALLKTK
ncbi:putative ERG25-C-4 methyl sterol oxidase [Tilletiaria anomala UBC 951]|uniref:Putative ERG25-C-4 methyl sterol oxidase n=1 Tax=Tilletiaria anomala (strain ATCC 24038 / CBS 436.72 / UBC 951) TaxID=1037660 RepID=A0A066VS25_TILAU|nr:putative ERG25-C-4 methyl sterol oxidase [Tilletiaria anomala UBC 951]KDN41609.1 putative ERG25-C-4 methyl sterol oxidase [Tilletiaria anomala UBC 951]